MTSNEQNKQNRNKLIDTENMLTAIRGEGARVKKVKGLAKKDTHRKTQYNDYKRDGGMVNCDRKRLDFGW